MAYVRSTCSPTSSPDAVACCHSLGLMHDARHSLQTLPMPSFGRPQPRCRSCWVKQTERELPSSHTCSFLVKPVVLNAKDTGAHEVRAQPRRAQTAQRNRRQCVDDTAWCPCMHPSTPPIPLLLGPLSRFPDHSFYWHHRVDKHGSARRELACLAAREGEASSLARRTMCSAGAGGRHKLCTSPVFQLLMPPLATKGASAGGPA